MKDIFKFIFTFSWSEKVIEKTNDEKFKLLIFFIFLSIITFLWKSYYISWKIFDSFLILNITYILKFILFHWFFIFIIFKIFKIKYNFLDSLFFISIPFLVINIWNFLMSLDNYYNWNSISIPFSVIFLFYIPKIWAFILTFILVKNSSKNVFLSLLIIILIASYQYYKYTTITYY